MVPVGGPTLFFGEISGWSRDPEKGVQQARGDGDAYYVVGKGENQVLLDIPHSGPAQRYGSHYALKLTRDKREQDFQQMVKKQGGWGLPRTTVAP